MFVDKQNEPRNDVRSYVRSPKVIKISILCGRISISQGFHKTVMRRSKEMICNDCKMAGKTTF